MVRNIAVNHTSCYTENEEHTTQDLSTSNLMHFFFLNSHVSGLIETDKLTES